MARVRASERYLSHTDTHTHNGLAVTDDANHNARMFVYTRTSKLPHTKGLMVIQKNAIDQARSWWITG